LTLHLALIVLYSSVVVALGLWTARYVRSSSAFFVAGRSLGPGLLFASMLAANIGAGSTVGAAGLAYRDGLSAWWWVGSAGLGSLVFALTVAPRLWRLAKQHDFYTTGDYLEFRYGPRVRAAAVVLVNLGALALLAGQLIAGAAILEAVAGVPRWAGSLIGGAIMTVYFTAGGLLGTAWVNALQLVVMLAGFSLALPAVLAQAGGASLFDGSAAPESFASPFYSSGPGSGWTLLALTGPAFIVSPGLIQKAFGARSERAVRVGVAWNAIALMLFAFMPVLLGMSARVLMPGVTDHNAVLPMLLAYHVPAWIGAFALAAVFSTEVDTSDAILFMLSTSFSQDVYRRFLNPHASDARLLMVGRVTAVAGGAAGILLSIWLQTVIGAITVFYSLLVVTLGVPIVGGLYSRRAVERDALAAIATGVVTLLVLFGLRVGLADAPAWIDPTLGGIVAGALAYLASIVVGGDPASARPASSS
jgi:SSS family solute:Na+ symporter